MKIYAEEHFCLGLAVQSVFGCPTEVEEEWSFVGKPPAAAPLGLMFQRGEKLPTSNRVEDLHPYSFRWDSSGIVYGSKRQF